MGKVFQVGDWKLLYILSKNMEQLAFDEFLYELSEHCKKLDNNFSSKTKEVKTATKQKNYKIDEVLQKPFLPSV